MRRNGTIAHVSIPPAFLPAQAERLRKLPCRGTFEVHLTVRADGPERHEEFRRLCAGLGVQCVLIEWARGVSRSQPTTASYYRGSPGGSVG